MLSVGRAYSLVAGMGNERAGWAVAGRGDVEEAVTYLNFGAIRWRRCDPIVMNSVTQARLQLPRMLRTLMAPLDTSGHG